MTVPRKKVLIVGEAASGKTALFERLTKGAESQFDTKYTPTKVVSKPEIINNNSEAKELSLEQPFELQDFPGHPVFLPEDPLPPPLYYNQADILIITLDSQSDLDEQISNFKNDVQSSLQKNKQREFIFIVTKSDLFSDLSEVSSCQFTPKEAKERVTTQFNSKILFFSAKTGFEETPEFKRELPEDSIYFNPEDNIDPIEVEKSRLNEDHGNLVSKPQIVAILKNLYVSKTNSDTLEEKAISKLSTITSHYFMHLLDEAGIDAVDIRRHINEKGVLKEVIDKIQCLEKKAPLLYDKLLICIDLLSTLQNDDTPSTTLSKYKNKIHKHKNKLEEHRNPKTDAYLNIFGVFLASCTGILFPIVVYRACHGTLFKPGPTEGEDMMKNADKIIKKYKKI